MALSLVISIHSDQNSHREAMKSPEMCKWTEEMKLEHKSLINIMTWKLVPRMYDKNFISIKWVCKV